MSFERNEFYSEIEVVVRGAEGDARDRFEGHLVTVLGEFELRPVISHAPPEGAESTPELLIDGELVVRGLLPPEQLKRAIRRRIGEW